MKRLACVIGLPILALLWSLDGLPARAELNPGQTLGQDNWQAAKGLMPDSVLRRFADGSC